MQSPKLRNLLNNEGCCFYSSGCTLWWGSRILLVQEAQSGSNLESAKRNLEAARKERLERNRQETTDFTQKERELREHIKNSGAGQLWF